MERSNGKSQGHRLQNELSRWFHSLLEFEGTGKLVEPLTSLKRKIDALVATGWKLKMSDDKSPADKAGIDFVWTHPTRGWFALDAKATGNVRCGMVHLVTVRNTVEAGEYKQLMAEDRIDFVRLLIKLSSQEGISHQHCAYPSLQAASVKDSLEAVRQFQRRLQAESHRTGEQSYEDWAIVLRKAIGFLVTQTGKGGPSQGAIDQVRRIIFGELDAFFTSFFDKNNMCASKCMHLQTSMRRSDKLAYEITGDKIKATVGPHHELVIMGGLADAIRQRFASRYSQLVEQHAAAEWLTQRRRTFETKGVECALHHVLNALGRHQGVRAVA